MWESESESAKATHAVSGRTRVGSIGFIRRQKACPRYSREQARVTGESEREREQASWNGSKRVGKNEGAKERGTEGSRAKERERAREKERERARNRAGRRGGEIHKFSLKGISHVSVRRLLAAAAVMLQQVDAPGRERCGINALVLEGTVVGFGAVEARAALGLPSVRVPVDAGGSTNQWVGGRVCERDRWKERMERAEGEHTHTHTVCERERGGGSPSASSHIDCHSPPYPALAQTHTHYILESGRRNVCSTRFVTGNPPTHMPNLRPSWWIWSPSQTMPCGYRSVLTVSVPSAPRKPVE